MKFSELALSGGAAAAVALLSMTVAEAVRPWRLTTSLTGRRWLGNIAVWGLGVALYAVLAQALAPATAWLAEIRPPTAAPLWLQLALGLPALDALTYALHRALHASAFLWRFHALHHADPEFDISTTLRHHPVESIVVVGFTALLALAAGLSLVVVAIFGWLNFCLQVFNHANVALPARVSAILGQVVVTPELHRIHHSRDAADAARNYGMILSVWDRLFGTLRLRPARGTDALEFGLDGFREAAAQRIDRMLWQPLLIGTRGPVPDEPAVADSGQPRGGRDRPEARAKP